MRVERAFLISALASAAVLGASGGGADPARGAAPSGDVAKLGLRALALAPIAFEPNLGQTEGRSEYLARGPGYGLFFARAEMSFALDGRGALPADDPATAHGVIVRMRWIGAVRSSPPLGEQPLTSWSNYVRGEDPSKWLYGVPHFGRVRYHRLYDGIDLVVHGHGEAPEYDYIVAPGAEPSKIEMEFAGGDSVRIDDAGDLVIRTVGGDVVHRAPLAFQKNEDGRSRRVAASFVLREGGRVGFSVGDFDRERELVIDPKVFYATLLGNTDKEVAFDVAEDGAGRVYVVGRASSSGESGSTRNDAFVTKIGLCCGPYPHVIYTTRIGGLSGDQAATSVAVAGQEPHIVGATVSNDFPLTMKRVYPLVRNADGIRLHKQATGDAFYVRLNASGDVLTSTLIGGHGSDEARSIAVRDGFAYITGTTESPDFPVVAADGVPGGSSAGISGTCPKIAFAIKLDLGQGSGIDRIVYSTYLPGSNPGDVWSRQSIGAAVGADAAGVAYVVGMRRKGTVGPGGSVPSSGLCSFYTFEANLPVLWKIGPAGKLVSVTTLGNVRMTPYDIAVTSGGEQWIVGSVSDESPPQLVEIHPLQHGRNGGEDAFIMRLTANGGFLFSTYFGGEGNDRATGVALHPVYGVPYITGTTTSSHLSRKNEISQIGGLFVLGLNSKNEPVFSTKYYGRPHGDQGPAIAADKYGRAYIVGTTETPGFAVTEGAFHSEIQGGRDAFLVILSPDRVLSHR